MTHQNPNTNKQTDSARAANRQRKPGNRNIVGFGFDFHPEVFIASAVLIFLFVTITLIFREPAESAFGAVQSGIAEGMGWFFILSVSFYLGLALLQQY
ncbi:MAG: hypothetical protein AB8B99_22570 [Phormidesmis sp.]